MQTVRAGGGQMLAAAALLLGAIAGIVAAQDSPPATLLPKPASWSRVDQSLYSRYEAGGGPAAVQSLRPLLASAADSLIETAVHRSPTGWVAATYLDSRQAAAGALLQARSDEPPSAQRSAAIDAAELLLRCDALIADGWTAAARALLYRLEPDLRYRPRPEDGGLPPLAWYELASAAGLFDSTAVAAAGSDVVDGSDVLDVPAAAGAAGAAAGAVADLLATQLDRGDRDLQAAAQELSPERVRLAQLWARLAYCSLLDGDRERFELEAAMAERVFGEAAYQPTWNVFAGSEATEPATGGTLGAALAAWREQLTVQENLTRKSAGGFELRRFDKLLLEHRFDDSAVGTAALPPPAWTQLSSGETICLVRRSRQLYAWDAVAGAFWPRSDRPELLQWAEQSPPAELAAADWPLLGGIAIDQGRVLAAIDEPGRSEAATRRLGDTAALGLNLSRQAAVMSGSPLTFAEFAAELDREGLRLSGRFVGTPLCAGEAAYTLVEEAAGTFRVAAFRWPSLAPHWVSEPLGGSRVRATMSEAARRSAMLLHQGRLFVCTGRGCIAAIDAADGDALFQILYASGPEPSRFDAREEPSPPASRLLIDRDMLICNPSDCETFFAVHWDDGRVVWQAERAAARRSRQVVAVRDHQAICVGERVQRFDAASGRLLRAAELPVFATASDPATATTVGASLLWSGGDRVFQWPLDAVEPTYQMVAPEQLVWWACPLAGPLSFAAAGEYFAVLSPEGWQVWGR